jgi:hypothetical protein
MATKIMFVPRESVKAVLEMAKRMGYPVAPASQSAKGALIRPFIMKTCSTTKRVERVGSGLFVVYEKDGSHMTKPAGFLRELAGRFSERGITIE